MNKSFCIFPVLLMFLPLFASEHCATPNTEPRLQPGQCYSEGYVCNLATESNGAVRFNLGVDSTCTNRAKTHFITYPHVNNDSLDMNAPDSTLRPLLIEDVAEGVDALSLVVNTAFLINAFNSRIKVGVTYHQTQITFQDANSVRLVGIYAITE